MLAPTLLTRAALPGMLSRGSGTIVNVAGMLAFSRPAPSSLLPRRAVYTGSLANIVAMSQAQSADDVVTGARRGLELGEVVSAPGVTD